VPDSLSAQISENQRPIAFAFAFVFAFDSRSFALIRG
jgi:hypothetical protein